MNEERRQGTDIMARNHPSETMKNRLVRRPDIIASDVNPISMMFDPIISERVHDIAQTMAKGTISVPQHLRGNVADCLAIVMQAATWQLNPFLVAQKTFIYKGKLGYEAQLVHAAVKGSGRLRGSLSYEYRGDWGKVAKRPKIMKSEKGEYPVPGWTEKDEEGLSLVVKGYLRGDLEEKSLKIDLATVWPRRSTLWAVDCPQQIAYLGQKRWFRKYAADVLMGVYTRDELQEADEIRVAGERIDEEQTWPDAAELHTRDQEKPPQREPQRDIETWPQERDGVLYDARGIPWMEHIHSAGRSCTQRGWWRRARGVAPTYVEELEQKWLAGQKTTAAEEQESDAEPDREQEAAEEAPFDLTEPPAEGSKEWFIEGVRGAEDADDVLWFEDAMRIHNLDLEDAEWVHVAINERLSQLETEAERQQEPGRAQAE